MRLRQLRLNICLVLLAFGLQAGLKGQESGTLSQKLLLESTIQQRVTNAIAKILDEAQFVVDVKVELTQALGGQPESVYRAPGGDLRPADEAQTGVSRSGRTTSPFPIPGFPEQAFDSGEPVQPLGEPTEESSFAPRSAEDMSAAATEELRRLAGEGAVPLPKIQSMALNIILADGVSPQLIENVRQVALVASRFDKDRGDALTITTASFKDSGTYAQRYGRTSPSGVGLQSETELLRTNLREAERRNEELLEEIRAKESEYLARSEEERKKALADLAQVQNERSKDLIFLQQQREEQNTRMQESLLGTIDDLRKELISGGLSPEERDIKALQASSLEDSLAALRQTFEAEKTRLQEQIEAALNRAPERPRGLAGLWEDNQGLFFLGLIILIGFLFLFALMLVTRSRSQVPPMGTAYPGAYPPPYPRRRPAKSRRAPSQKRRTSSRDEAATAPEVPVEQAATTPQAKPETDAPAGIQEDLHKIRQSVVSMSVGRQQAANRILSEWLSGGSVTSEGGEEGEGAAGIAAVLGEEES